MATFKHEGLGSLALRGCSHTTVPMLQLPYTMTSLLRMTGNGRLPASESSRDEGDLELAGRTGGLRKAKASGSVEPTLTPPGSRPPSFWGVRCAGAILF